MRPPTIASENSDKIRAKAAMTEPKKPRILLVSTGGTITMVANGEGTLSPCDDADKLLSLVPEIRTLADVDVLPLVNLDSANLQPDLWLSLSQTIYERMSSYDGFVVTHGTDTLAFTAAALSFILQELPKPVVITGAQVPLGDIGSDGRSNLINAFRVAVLDIAEVVVVFGSQVIRGTRAKKTSAFDLQAFSSVNSPPIGTIGLSILLQGGHRNRSRRKPLLRNFLSQDVAMISVYPGLKPYIIAFLASKHRGIVIEGYGSGNIPTEGVASLCPAIAAATARKVAVVVCTQCMVGSTEMELYQVGRAALKAGAIPAMDMTPETSLVKLMWVLGQTNDLGTVESMMQKAVAGEVHEIQ